MAESPIGINQPTQEQKINPQKTPRPSWWIPQTLEEGLGEQVDIKEIYASTGRPIGKTQENGLTLTMYEDNGTLENFHALRLNFYAETLNQLTELYGKADLDKHQKFASQQATLSAQRILSERLRTQEQYKESRIDPLTGLPNRKAVFERLRELSESGTPYSILFCDLDHFKKINDDPTLGHDVGDLVLAQAAQRAQSSVRQDKITMPGGTEQPSDIRTTDMVGRYGGEELIIIVSGENTPDELSAIGNRVVTTFNSEQFATDIEGAKPKISVTVSVGGAVAKPGENPMDVLKHADKSVYAAKHNGRNQYIDISTAGIQHVNG